MKPLETTSGNLLADRRADYAEMLSQSGDHGAAADLMLDALELAPSWALGWFRLGELYESAGRRPEAARAWTTVLHLDPDDRAGALLKLELAGVARRSAAPPSAFVEALFDQYAPAFDSALVDKLGYRVPDLLRDAIQAQASGPFERVVDLGCGTGLMGVQLRPVSNHLEGYDISAGMLKKAEAKKVYDGLFKVDIQTMTLPDAQADLIVAADVFMYVGALDRTMRLAADALRAGGLFAFSVERHDGDENFILRESRRYAHSQSYVLGQAEATGLVLLSHQVATIRMDRGAPIEGLIVVARRPA